MVSRRTFLKYTGGTALTLFAYGKLSGLRRAIAQIQGGTLNPRSVKKYATPMLIPPVMPRAGTVVLPGGIDLNRPVPVAMTFPGAPTLQQQEEAFLFLLREETLNDTYAVTGFAQGKYSIIDDGKGQKLVSRDLSRLRLQRGSSANRGNRQLTSLAEFKEKVRAAAW